MVNSTDRIYGGVSYERTHTRNEKSTDKSFGDALSAAVDCAQKQMNVSSAEAAKSKNEDEYCFWEHRMDLTERCFEQRQEMCVKKHYAKLHETERQMLLGKDYKGVIPTLSAAEILFDLLMDCGQ